MVLMQKPSVIDSPSGGAPEKAPRWDLTGTKGCGGGNRVSWCSWMFSGYMSIYRRKKQVGGAMRGPRGWGRAQGGRPTSLPRGLLVDFWTSTPSPLDHGCSKNNSPKGFIPFDIPFLRNTEIGKKTAICTRPLVSRLIPKIIQKGRLKPIKHPKQII